MSFSSKVKEELSRQVSSARHCQIAEAAAIFRMCGRIAAVGDGQYQLVLRIENQAVAKKFSALLKKSFDISPEAAVGGDAHTLAVCGSGDVLRVLRAMKLIDEQECPEERKDFISSMVVQNSCCKRAFIRGAFLAGGSISNPEKSYHLEIVCANAEKAAQLQTLISSFDIEAKTVLRKKYHVLYIKEGNQIVDMLGVMGANVALMELENVRILKEMRGTVNRKVNCETANINKTVSAAVEQMNDILYIRDRIGFDKLPEGLEEVAVARLEQPDATLKELGCSLEPPVGKSGVNHRLRKLKELASALREDEEESL
ncbi:DNA-binding protein WhiA [Lacrimispora sp. NSJ-141]|uniref:Probable cell division protein WhiA n=1 Tax=Lientehia hominis TaxID=2897778 RepID=A0AAP2RI02_9FIRM|nr:DNA-binding protein WhiA [Lientehia hominis]MCD2491824.1 DNA-binding protein WhiA [Lientehia hominis]